MRYCISALLLACLSSTGQAAGKDTRPSLCLPQEDAVFACKSGGKIISLCASRGLDERSGYLQYRFGTKRKLELEYPVSKSTSPRDAFVLGQSSIGGGGTDFLRFQIGANSYFLFSWMSRDHKVKDGVFVERGGKRISALICRDEALDPDYNWSLVYKAKLPKLDILFQPW